MVHSPSLVLRAWEIMRLWLAWKTINTQMRISSRKAFCSFLFTSPSVREPIFPAAISRARVLLRHLKLLIYLFSSTVEPLICWTLLPSFTFPPLCLEAQSCSSLPLSLYPNFCTLLPPNPPTPHILPSLPPIITPSYLYWTSNRIHFPRTAGPARELLLIFVQASLFDSLQMSLNPL